MTEILAPNHSVYREESKNPGLVGAHEEKKESNREMQGASTDQAAHLNRRINREDEEYGSGTMRGTEVSQGAAAFLADFGGKVAQTGAAGATTARNMNVDTDSEITLSSENDDD